MSISVLGVTYSENEWKFLNSAMLVVEVPPDEAE
jgi:hypothetical protein